MPQEVDQWKEEFQEACRKFSLQYKSSKITIPEINIAADFCQFAENWFQSKIKEQSHETLHYKNLLNVANAMLQGREQFIQRVYDTKESELTAKDQRIKELEKEVERLKEDYEDDVIFCPSCGKIWNLTNHNACECGAVKSSLDY